MRPSAPRKCQKEIVTTVPRHLISIGEFIEKFPLDFPPIYALSLVVTPDPIAPLFHETSTNKENTFLFSTRIYVSLRLYDIFVSIPSTPAEALEKC